MDGDRSGVYYQCRITRRARRIIGQQSYHGRAERDVVEFQKMSNELHSQGPAVVASGESWWKGEGDIT